MFGRKNNEDQSLYIKLIIIVLAITLTFSAISLIPTSFAHQDGCHSKHSCPSDSGKYTCGDTGNCSKCSDNQYCKAGQYTPSSSTKPSSNPNSSSQNSKCLGTTMCINDKVTKIIDGDTIQVGTYKIRLALTNTPEKNQPGFKEATEFTKSLCPINSLAIVDQDDKQPYDKYKRMVGKVFCGNKVLNSELLYSNHANILTTYCKTSEFSSEPWAKKFGC